MGVHELVLKSLKTLNFVTRLTESKKADSAVIGIKIDEIVCSACMQVAGDFAFIPFGGGVRKCVGDQFALVEATVAISMLLRCCATVLHSARLQCLLHHVL